MIESNYEDVTDSFDSMELKAELLRGVYAYGFERPSAIQQRAIMPIIKGRLLPAPLLVDRWSISQRNKTNPRQVTMSSLRPSPVLERLPLSPSPPSRRSTPTSRPARL